MAKKTKRPSRKEAIPSIEKRIDDPLIINRPSGFNPDYSSVTRDLRRVGVLAGSFIIALVALSYLLH